LVAFHSTSPESLLVAGHAASVVGCVHRQACGSDQELRQDDIGKDERYARTDEYLDTVRRKWTSTAPFEHHWTIIMSSSLSPR
jgi:alkanesulfonate monooxygenase